MMKAKAEKKEHWTRMHWRAIYKAQEVRLKCKGYYEPNMLPFIPSTNFSVN